MLRLSGTEQHRQKTFSQVQGVEDLLSELGETRPSSAETSHLWVATKAVESVLRDRWSTLWVVKGWKGKQYLEDEKVLFDSTYLMHSCLFFLNQPALIELYYFNIAENIQSEWCHSR